LYFLLCDTELHTQTEKSDGDDFWRLYLMQKELRVLIFY